MSIVTLLVPKKKIYCFVNFCWSIKISRQKIKFYKYHQNSLKSDIMAKKIKF